MYIFFWRGLGWLVLAFGVVFYGLFKAVLPAQSDDFLAALIYMCGSVPIWFVGRYLRKNYTTSVKDENTGKTLRVRQPHHAFFFIPIHFWAPIFFALGVFLLIYPPSRTRGDSQPSIIRDDYRRESETSYRVWSSFMSPAGDFSISAPAPLIDKSEELQDAVGTIYRHRYCVSVAGRYFAVERWDYPQGAISARPVSDVLDGARDGEVKGISGILLAESSASLGGNIGREFKIENRAGTLMARSRMFVTGDHAYSVMVVTPPYDQNSPSIAQFFESFRITRKLQ